MGFFGNPAAPEVQAAILKAEAKAKVLKMPLGTVSGNWEQARPFTSRGYQFDDPRLRRRPGL